jgi:hypothetical protein
MNFIIGLTTFDLENLRISLPKLNEFADRIFLIIHNDNPEFVLTPERVKKYGFDGELCIINNSTNEGPYKARINIIKKAQELARPEPWFIFADDDDLLLDLTPPDSPSVAALQQNMIFIRRRMIDLLKILENSANYTIDGENITVEAPHIGIVGTIFNTGDLIRFNNTLYPSLDAIRAVDNSFPYRAPEDIVMWFCFMMFLGGSMDSRASGRVHYRNRTNYAAALLDFTPGKYGKDKIPTDKPQEWYDKVMSQYVQAYLDGLGQN